MKYQGLRTQLWEINTSNKPPNYPRTIVLSLETRQGLSFPYLDFCLGIYQGSYWIAFGA